MRQLQLEQLLDLPQLVLLQVPAQQAGEGWVLLSPGAEPVAQMVQIDAAGNDEALNPVFDGGEPGRRERSVQVSGIPVDARVAAAREHGSLTLLGLHQIAFDYRDDLVMHRTETLPFHANGMRFTAYDEQGETLQTRVYYSVGGGFVVDESATGADAIVDDPTPVKYPFSSAEELLAQCREHGLSISSLMLANEQAWRSEAEVRSGLLSLWEAMQACIDRGCRTEGKVA